jgi:cyclic pyranopterin phosphate synthase
MAVEEKESETNENNSKYSIQTNKYVYDSYNRPITSLRLSITHECNLACFYCHKEGMVKDKRQMTPAEIERLVKLGAELGIQKVKLTGGELLLRPDVVEIVQRISPLMTEVSLTTNAIKLTPLAKPLKTAGLSRVNISLHTIQPESYKKICGVDRLNAALAGLEAAISVGLQPIKINMVLLKGINDHQVSEMLSFAAEKGAILQIIEFETDKERINGRLYLEHHQDFQKLRDWLLISGRIIGSNPLHRREKLLLSWLPDDKKLSQPVVVELVMPMHNTEFCANCTRIRLTAGGYVKGCLFNKTNVVDILGPLRTGMNDQNLKDLFLNVIRNRKPYWTSTDQKVITKTGIRGEIN